MAPPNMPQEGQSAELQVAFPTDSKMREKARRKAEKEQGIERVVKKTKKIVEEHYDDCGDDLSSLDKDPALLCQLCGCDTDTELQEEDYDTCLVRQLAEPCYPIDMDKVVWGHPGEPTPPKGRDHRAPERKENSACPACRSCRGRTDWTHTREIGQCWYPHDDPWIPACEACQQRLRRWEGDHTFRKGECN